MTPTGQRLMAQFRQDQDIELARLPAGQYFAESAVRALTSEMGPDWRTWIESPMRDHEAIGRRVDFTPKLNGYTPPEQPDADLAVETYTAERAEFKPIEA